ncbi:2,3-diphosphoglycerate-dependent phosphoglycerate mutase [Azospirillum picis]|uniref:2,3-bisphosphoglycerate-dependent phosphoglycerate mutase n=1 Tax=Azospirillum picis TaxID=488438 RepID=A0ABU0MGV0_9PROT|nr:2,3-diphosphoglycerate-dependent phosphoglycerate mutase [Azospirillum picis]MBP2299099.1 2,3-bisphosphoglycerate-dependent phosphoglycerate mutase [Azospirillum picis]MDQ0532659.1 2,3-bisphosphoglycerate-dependent phosphoglycerate mutase [Azospirillum picis]
MHRLILLRHGQSVWNAEDRFTGWTDVGLTDRGIAETRQAAALLKEAGMDVDIAFTSVLSRAIETLHIVLRDMDRLWLPVHKHWRLNERHYGALQGLNKAETAERHGADQVFQWRRSWDVPPPPIEPDDRRSAVIDRRYDGIATSNLPRGESLKDTTARVVPYWTETISPALRLGSRVLVSAHGNSLRALVKHLDNVADQDIPLFEIPTSRPLVYELGADLMPLRRYFLGEGGTVEEITWPKPEPGAAA